MIPVGLLAYHPVIYTLRDSRPFVIVSRIKLVAYSVIGLHQSTGVEVTDIIWVNYTIHDLLKGYLIQNQK